MYLGNDEYYFYYVIEFLLASLVFAFLIDKTQFKKYINEKFKRYQLLIFACIGFLLDGLVVYLLHKLEANYFIGAPINGIFMAIYMYLFVLFLQYKK